MKNLLHRYSRSSASITPMTPGRRHGGSFFDRPAVAAIDVRGGGPAMKQKMASRAIATAAARGR